MCGGLVVACRACLLRCTLCCHHLLQHTHEMDVSLVWFLRGNLHFFVQSKNHWSVSLFLSFFMVQLNSFWLVPLMFKIVVMATGKRLLMLLQGKNGISFWVVVWRWPVPIVYLSLPKKRNESKLFPSSRFFVHFYSDYTCLDIQIPELYLLFNSKSQIFLVYQLW